jgi:hypothetical protein
MTVLIYRCANGHINFAKDLQYCGSKDCGQRIDAISDADIEWFYKINPTGLAINEKDLNMIIKDKNMPEEVKNAIREAFPQLAQKKRFWFG